MKLLTTLAALLLSTAAYADGPTWTPPHEPRPVPPVSAPNWGGMYIGGHVGHAAVSTTETWSEDIFETRTRDVIDQQCWKWWNGGWNQGLADNYCTGPFEQGMKQHYFDNAQWRDVVTGTEEYEHFVGTEYFEETTSDQFLTYGAHIGYNFDLGRIVVGPEISYTVYRTDAFPIDGVLTVAGRVGMDMGRLMPYAHVGYSWAGVDEGLSYGGGLDIAITRRIIAGIKYSHYDFETYPHDAVEVRLSVRF